MSQKALEKEFVESFTNYGDAIFRFCLLKVSNVALAEDLTQEVFTRYWQSLRTGSEMTNTRSFLYTIAHNLAKDWYKKKKSCSLDEQIEQGYDPRDHQALSAEQEAQYNEIIKAMDGLEQKDREILLLRYVEGLDPKDIALILQESANAVSVRLHRATKQLQQIMHTQL